MPLRMWETRTTGTRKCVSDESPGCDKIICYYVYTIVLRIDTCSYQHICHVSRVPRTEWMLRRMAATSSAARAPAADAMVVFDLDGEDTRSSSRGLRISLTPCRALVPCALSLLLVSGDVHALGWRRSI